MWQRMRSSGQLKVVDFTHLPQAPLRVGTNFMTPFAAVWDLGFLFDSHMLTSSHVRKTVSTCFSMLRQLRSIRRSMSRPVVQSLVTSHVLSHLDYGNVTLVGIPQHFLRRLQSVMNAAARLIYLSSKFDHINPLLHQLHWLKAKDWMTSNSHYLFSSASIPHQWT